MDESSLLITLVVLAVACPLFMWLMMRRGPKRGDERGRT